MPIASSERPHGCRGEGHLKHPRRSCNPHRLGSMAEDIEGRPEEVSDGHDHGLPRCRWRRRNPLVDQRVARPGDWQWRIQRQHFDHQRLDSRQRRPHWRLQVLRKHRQAPSPRSRVRICISIWRNTSRRKRTVHMARRGLLCEPPHCSRRQLLQRPAVFSSAFIRIAARRSRISGSPFSSARGVK